MDQESAAGEAAISKRHVRRTSNRTLILLERTMTRIEIDEQELSSSAPLSSLLSPPKRNLGCGILIAAIEDYLSLDDQTQSSSAHFLFPTVPEYRERYEWVISMAPGVNPAWLRDALDHARPNWDRQRAERKLERKLAHQLQARMTA